MQARHRIFTRPDRRRRSACHPRSMERYGVEQGKRNGAQPERALPSILEVVGRLQASSGLFQLVPLDAE
jgi:hypothetical protein